MRLIRGAVIASWKLFPIPRPGDVKHHRLWQCLNAPHGVEDECKTLAEQSKTALLHFHIITTFRQIFCCAHFQPAHRFVQFVFFLMMPLRLSHIPSTVINAEAIFRNDVGVIGHYEVSRSGKATWPHHRGSGVSPVWKRGKLIILQKWSCEVWSWGTTLRQYCSVSVERQRLLRLLQISRPTVVRENVSICLREAMVRWMASGPHAEQVFKNVHNFLPASRQRRSQQAFKRALHATYSRLGESTGSKCLKTDNPPTLDECRPS